MPRIDKITPDNIDIHVNNGALKQRGFGYKMFSLLYSLHGAGLTVSAVAIIMNKNQKTMHKWFEVEKEKRRLKQVADNEAIDEYSHF